jgi:hypothetical protein
MTARPWFHAKACPGRGPGAGRVDSAAVAAAVGGLGVAVTLGVYARWLRPCVFNWGAKRLA